jgi:uncharacterized protein (DUF169 family)
MTTGARLHDLLGLRASPVAITFRDSPPLNVPRVGATAPSSCTYWKQAAEGRTFYTEEQDHYQCPIGAYTHGADLPPEVAKELDGVAGKMIHLGYLRAEEVADIPRRQGGLRFAVYAPLDGPATEADVVLVRGNAKQIMLLAEAAQAAAVAASGLMGRPTCAAIPQALRDQRGVASLGCIGNRVYTGLADDELYFALPGKHLAAVLEKLALIVSANHELEKYHQAKMDTFVESLT